MSKIFQDQYFEEIMMILFALF